MPINEVRHMGSHSDSIETNTLEIDDQPLQCTGKHPMQEEEQFSANREGIG